jgi:hypothetical protein|eukprot:COSAG01_NODE_28918_length_649_cov_3.560000_1_plen_148_part_00
MRERLAAHSARGMTDKKKSDGRDDWMARRKAVHREKEPEEPELAPEEEELEPAPEEETSGFELLPNTIIFARSPLRPRCDVYHVRGAGVELPHQHSPTNPRQDPTTSSFILCILSSQPMKLEVVRGLPSRGWRPSGEGGRWLGEPKR